MALLVTQGLYGLSFAALSGAITCMLVAPEAPYADALLFQAIALFFCANLIGGLRLLWGLIATTQALNLLRSRHSH